MTTPREQNRSIIDGPHWFLQEIQQTASICAFSILWNSVYVHCQTPHCVRTKEAKAITAWAKEWILTPRIVSGAAVWIPQPISLRFPSAQPFTWEARHPVPLHWKTWQLTNVLRPPSSLKPQAAALKQSCPGPLWGPEKPGNCFNPILCEPNRALWLQRSLFGLETEKQSESESAAKSALAVSTGLFMLACISIALLTRVNQKLVCVLWCGDNVISCCLLSFNTLAQNRWLNHELWGWETRSRWRPKVWWSQTKQDIDSG